VTVLTDMFKIRREKDKKENKRNLNNKKDMEKKQVHHL